MATRTSDHRKTPGQRQGSAIRRLTLHLQTRTESGRDCFQFASRPVGDQPPSLLVDPPMVTAAEEQDVVQARLATRGPMLEVVTVSVLMWYGYAAPRCC